MITRPATDFDYAFVCAHMRAKSWREATAMRGEITPARLACQYNLFAGIAHFRVACCRHVEPIALFAAYRTGIAGCVAVHFVATEEWPAIGNAAYRFLRQTVFGSWFPQLRIARAETDVLVSGDDADFTWLYRLGFYREVPARQSGNGAWFQRMIWEAGRPAVDGRLVVLASEQPVARSDTLLSAGPLRPPLGEPCDGSTRRLTGPHV